MFFKQMTGALRKNRKMQALSVVFILGVCVNVFFYSALGAPAVLDKAALRSDLAAVDARLQEAEKDRALYESFLSGQADIDRFKDRLPARVEYTDLIKDVYSMARKDGMLLLSYGATTNPVSQSGGLEQVSFSLPVSGSYEEVRRFIYDIETSGLFLNIDNLGLSNTGEGSINLTIGLSTYVR